MNKTYEQLYEEQLSLEKEAQDTKIRKEYIAITDAITNGRFDETNIGSALLRTYFKPILKKIQDYYDKDFGKFAGHTVKTQNYIKYLCPDPKILAYITVQALIKKLAQRANKVKTVTISEYVLSLLRIQRTFESVSESNPKLIAYLGSEYRRASTNRKRILMEKHLKEFADTTRLTNKSMDVKAGATILELILQSGTGLIEQRKLFHKGIDTHSTLYISFTPEVMEILKDTYYINPSQALYLPMVVIPKDWVSLTSGGYYTGHHYFMKFKSKKARTVFQEEDLSRPMGVINKLQKTPYRVNKRVHSVIDYIFKNNLVDPRSPPTLPNLYGGIPTIELYKTEDLMEGYDWIDNPTPEQKKEWALWNKKREKIQIGLDGEFGRRLQYLMTMGVANRMLEYDKFYYSYQLDYRGRVYPIADFFNPQSKGYTKAMLEFDDGKLLTEVGVYWLKVHIANCYGLDKIPFNERVKWVDDNEEDILLVARSPLMHKSKWVNADSPYEYLAGCMAYEDYLNGKEVHLPIQLDAVNSGIQMYSGLLRDKDGAKSTCTIGSERSDLYKEVADSVNTKLLNKKYPSYLTYFDKEGQEKVVETKVEAKSMVGKFTRKMTKRNIMTIPYSVSMRGMSQQNWDVMEDMELEGKDFWEGDKWVVNKLWTQLTHESAYEIVKGARAGQEYLKDVVRTLSHPTMWYTPIYNLPVYQAMFKNVEMRIKTVLGTLTLLEPTDEIKKQKQLAAVAANYIHSIDATILLYVVEHMDGDIGVIHDCFLVHPNDGEQVRDKYKEGYVRVMEADPLKMFQERLDPEGKIPIPYVGDLDLKEVYESEYIIS